jgi:glutaredoxin
LKIKAFTLSTCAYCWELKRFFNKNNIEYEFVDVDLLDGLEREEVKKEAQDHCPGCGYPITVIDGIKVVRGFDENALKRALRL